jgi:ribonuclease BN (tRNA processing enzyme)
MITLVTVGTGTVSPHPRRTSACHYVESGAPEHRPGDGPGGVRLLLDCGAGACHRLAAFGLPWRDLTHIALTHFHPDHYGELPALLFAMKYGARQPRKAPLELIGPTGTRARLEALAAAFGPWVLEPGFTLRTTEASPERPLSLPGGLTLSCHATPHTEESIAWSVATAEHRLVYTGDTGPSSPLADWSRGCDLLLAECSLPDPMALDIHLTPRSAGALAHRAQAKRLVLTHLYPPVEDVDIPAEVRREYAGPVAVAEDGSRFTVGS